MTTLSTRIARPTLLAFALALALPVAAPVAMAQSVGPATGQPSMSPKSGEMTMKLRVSIHFFPQSSAPHPAFAIAAPA